MQIFAPINKADKIGKNGITAQTIYNIVEKYTKKAGLEHVTPHDLRRTAAHLARKGGASIEQVQIMLGHASPQTTSDYIGEQLDLDDHAVDYIGIKG